ncbi:hypothetical protein M409DRAFT_69820 [Zasmidium cellare ATCC 36951]|uniref:Rieske domain-containing protein n=1 Tax=Zasmidium cellare ATCC 36951 TaxID=1080233 RepID=A0A6A6C5L8_ZASCE|nr:uncharacterized protein M409DRAFT_69820 [Zasmidium cellare ATCC 36951]KAF2161490.1 hypothetical protein M409DRAFT_69820 [Zasmidium cellare ATCC 36951]
MDAASPYLTAAASLLLATLLTLYLPSLLTTIPAKLLSLKTSLLTKPTTKPTPPPSPPLAVTKEPDFPPNWYTSPALYALEQRSILSKTWLHICHTSLFTHPGDYRTFTLANFSFILILGKDHKLRAFHNVCRHRAYTVCTRPEGRSTLLRCKYHGWTYDSMGRLVKAPKFDDIEGEVEGFRKDENGLFEIRSWVDSSGFLYVNFDVLGSDGLTIRVGVPMRASLSLVHSWVVESGFNWKIAIPSGSFRVKALATKSRMPELLGRVANSLGSWKWPAEFELAPLTRLLRSAKGDVFLTVSIIPTGSQSCNLACHLYSARADAKIETPVPIIKQEIAARVDKLQNIFDEVKETGEIPDAQSQEALLAEIKAHSRLERLMGEEVFPASRLRESSQACKVADDLCRQLEAEAATESAVKNKGGDALAW